MNYNLSSLGSCSCKYFYCQFHANWSDRLSYKDHIRHITVIILLSMYMYIDTCNNAVLLKPCTSSKYAFINMPYLIFLSFGALSLSNGPLKLEMSHWNEIEGPFDTLRKKLSQSLLIWEENSRELNVCLSFFRFLHTHSNTLLHTFLKQNLDWKQGSKFPYKNLLISHVNKSS